MAGKKRQPRAIKELDNILVFLSKEALKKTTMLGQAVIMAQIQNVKSVKESLNENDCFYCWRCIKTNTKDFFLFVKSLNPFVGSKKK